MARNSVVFVAALSIAASFLACGAFDSDVSGNTTDGGTDLPPDASTGTPEATSPRPDGADGAILPEAGDDSAADANIAPCSTDTLLAGQRELSGAYLHKAGYTEFPAFAVTPSNDIRAQCLQIYIDGANTTEEKPIEVGIYTLNPVDGEYPDIRIARGTIPASDTFGWKKVVLDVPIEVKANQRIWIGAGIFQGSTALRYRRVCTDDTSKKTAGLNKAEAPTTFSTVVARNESLCDLVAFLSP